MIKILFESLVFGKISTANADVYYYPNYSERGCIKDVCADRETNHIIELKAGRTMQLKGHGEDKFKYHKFAMCCPYRRYANPKNIYCFYRYQKDKQNRQIFETEYKRRTENCRNCDGMN